MPQHRTAALAGTALVVILALTGCANPLEQLAERATEEGIENLIESETGGEIDINTGGGATLPDSFPGEVPVVDGEILSALAVDGTWVLSISVDSAEAAEAGYDDLLNAGFSETASADLGGGMLINSVENDTYGVTYSVIVAEDDTVSVNLSVTTKS